MLETLRCRALGSSSRSAPASRNDWVWRVSTDPSYMYGPRELCVWKVGPDTFWFQTRDPQHARKLDKRKDTRRVGITGVDHYRRTYEMRGNWRKVKRIVDRYVMSASDTFSGALLRHSASKIAPRVRTAASRKGAKMGRQQDNVEHLR
jgi:hypothetical protein